VENIALPAGRVKGLLKTGAQAFAGIADNGLGGEALIAQFENANGPGITVAVLFLAKWSISQIRVGLPKGRWEVE